MRSRSVAAAVMIAVLAATGAVGCFVKVNKLRSDARWLLERGSAEGQEYANTFNDAVADMQLATLEQRREVLAQAALWQRAQLLLILLTVVSAFGSYILYLLAKLRAALEEANSALPHDLHKDGPAIAHANAAS